VLDLGSGGVSGAFHELDLLRRLEAAGFYGIEIDEWEGEPFAIVEGIEFRSVTITAGRARKVRAPRLARPYSTRVHGRRSSTTTAILWSVASARRSVQKPFGSFRAEPYVDETIGIEPMIPIPENAREEFDCARTEPRDPRETKSADYRISKRAEGSCC
jgi:hypothetical protein